MNKSQSDMPLSNKIIISETMDKDIKACLAYVCLHLQKEYDISPVLLNQIINNKQCIEYCVFLHDQCLSEMNESLSSFKDKFNHLSDHKYNTGEHDYERCGYMVKAHKNGYVQYCNFHKYLHPQKDFKCERDKTEMNKDLYKDHEFISKTDTQIIRECFQYGIYVTYQNYINKMYGLIKIIFDHYIKCHCNVSSIDYNAYEATLQSMKNDPLIFKSKSIYENLRGNNDNKEKSYYFKVYKFMA